MVEFGPLSRQQLALVDDHGWRAVGTVVPESHSTDGVVIEFWLPEQQTPGEAYDAIRGWAIGHRIPIRGLMEFE